MSHVKHHAIIVTGDEETIDEAIEISQAFLSATDGIHANQLSGIASQVYGSLNSIMIVSNGDKSMGQSCKKLEPLFDFLNNSQNLNVCWVYYGGDDRSEGFVDDPTEGIL